MSLFKNMLNANESLFINPIFLDFDSIPKLLPYRENQQHYIASCIKPLFQNRNGKNIILIGTPGIGKTATIKYIFRDLEEETEDIIPIYINCWKKETTYKIVLEICEQLDYKFTQNKNSEELLKIIAKTLNKKAVVFCFDEIDKIKSIDIIYTLLEDIYKKTIILITNENSFLNTLDQRIKSRLTPELVEFKPYNLEETKGILKQRVEHSLVPNIIEKSLFEKIVQKTFELQDIRIGLFLLKESATLAENQSSKKINPENVEEAIKKLTIFKTKDTDELAKEEKQILGLIKQNPEIRIIDLYEIYKANNGDLSYRTFHTKLKKLENASQISLKKITGGKEGKFNIVSYEKKLTEF